MLISILFVLFSGTAFANDANSDNLDYSTCGVITGNGYSECADKVRREALADSKARKKILRDRRDCQSRFVRAGSTGVEAARLCEGMNPMVGNGSYGGAIPLSEAQRMSMYGMGYGHQVNYAAIGMMTQPSMADVAALQEFAREANQMNRNLTDEVGMISHERNQAYKMRQNAENRVHTYEQKVSASDSELAELRKRLAEQEAENERVKAELVATRAEASEVLNSTTEGGE